jgi:hypothetical protein
MAAPSAPTNLAIVPDVLHASVSISGLQFDVVTTGTLGLTIGANFLMESATIATNTLRVLVYTLGQYTFSGPFARVNASVSSVSNVIGSDLDGEEVSVNVTY